MGEEVTITKWQMIKRGLNGGRCVWHGCRNDAWNYSGRFFSGRFRFRRLDHAIALSHEQRSDGFGVFEIGSFK